MIRSDVKGGSRCDALRYYVSIMDNGFGGRASTIRYVVLWGARAWDVLRI